MTTKTSHRRKARRPRRALSVRLPEDLIERIDISAETVGLRRTQFVELTLRKATGMPTLARPKPQPADPDQRDLFD